MSPLLRTVRTCRILVVAALAAFALSFGTPPARAETAPPAAPPVEQPAAPGTPAAVAKPVARREETDPTTLVDAKAALKTARAERDTAGGDLAAALAAHDKTKQLLSATLEIANKAKADLAAAQGENTRLAAAAEKEKAEHGKSKELLTLAEAACGVLGVSPANAVPAAAPSAAHAATPEGLREQLAACTDPVHRGQLAEQLRQLTTAKK